MLAVLSMVCAAPADPPGGWPDLFPELGVMYSRTVAAPEVAKGDKPTVYSQTARYEWTGGRIEVITVAAARDPAFVEKFAAEAMKKAEAVEVNKKRAYRLWEKAPKDSGKEPRERLVVVLADDKVLTVARNGTGMELADVVKKFDLGKLAKALDAPPPAAKKE